MALLRLCGRDVLGECEDVLGKRGSRGEDVVLVTGLAIVQ